VNIRDEVARAICEADWSADGKNEADEALRVIADRLETDRYDRSDPNDPRLRPRIVEDLRSAIGGST
jgi:hypothetical protein